jgi:hypothetical protein
MTRSQLMEKHGTFGLTSKEIEWLMIVQIIIVLIMIAVPCIN